MSVGGCVLIKAHHIHSIIILIFVKGHVITKMFFTKTYECNVFYHQVAEEMIILIL